MPSIADAEIERTALPEEDRIFRLITSGEHPDRAKVTAERLKVPLPRVVIGQRDARIVLDHHRAVGEQKLAHFRKAARMQEVRGALDEAVAGRERLQELQELAAAHAVVGNIGAE